MNCGSIPVNPKSAQENKEIIAEYIRISKISNKDTKIVQTIAWLMKSIEYKGTRWIPTEELVRFRWDDYIFNGIQGQEYLKKLSVSHRREILDIILATDMIELEELGIMYVIEKDYPIELINFLQYQLKKRNQHDYIVQIKTGNEHDYIIKSIFRRISQIEVVEKKTKIAEKYFEEYDNYMSELPYYTQPDEEKISYIINSFIREYEGVI